MDKIKIFVIDIDGTLTDGTLFYNELESETHLLFKKFNSKDFYALHRLLNDSYKILFVTENPDGLISRKFGHKCKIITHSKNKFDDVSRHLSENGLMWSNVAYIGDSETDLECICEAAFSACPSDATTEVLEESVYAAHASGGIGAVYEIIRYFYRLNKIDWII
jgi:YrbI family 3-deoxy-D-manno-octulosonate 8-phosphate phosphatase